MEMFFTAGKGEVMPLVVGADEAGTSRGRMTAYAFFVQVQPRDRADQIGPCQKKITSNQTCREEHKRQHPEEFVQFQEFSRKCASRWKTMTDR